MSETTELGHLVVINQKLDLILSRLGEASARPASGQGLPPAGMPRAKALATYDERWNGVKERWPGFRMHPKACEAFDRHIETLEGEPPLGALRRIAHERIGVGKAWQRAKFEANLKISYEKAQAIIYFLKISNLGTFVAGKGLVVSEIKS